MESVEYNQEKFLLSKLHELCEPGWYTEAEMERRVKEGAIVYAKLVDLEILKEIIESETDKK